MGYITDVADPNKPSIIPAWRHIRHNFFLSLYSSQCAVDTDDGSAYYKTYENFFPYAGNGLNSDTGGFRKSCDQRNMEITGNKVYNRKGSLSFDMCNNNTIETVPDDDMLIKWGMEVIGAHYMQEVTKLV